MKLSGADMQSPGDKYERGSERKSRLGRQLVGELQLWLFYSRGGATERKSEKESSGNGGGDLFKQRQRPWVGTLWMVSLLTYILTISYVTRCNVLHAYNFFFPG